MAQERCSTCNSVLINGYCYNNNCKAYDPLSQYFDGPTEEDVAEDTAAIIDRINKINEQINTNLDDTPF